MLHVAEGEVLYQPLLPISALKGGPQLAKQAAGDLLAEIYDFICKRWRPS
jgi:hypothetical protein